MAHHKDPWNEEGRNGSPIPRQSGRIELTFAVFFRVEDPSASITPVSLQVQETVPLTGSNGTDLLGSKERLYGIDQERRCRS